MSGKHALPDDHEANRRSMAPLLRRRIGPGPRSLSAADHHAGEWLNFGSIRVPEEAFDGLTVSLSGQSTSELHTIVVKDDATSRSFTAYATPTSGGWADGLDRLNTQQAIDSGARRVFSRAGPFGTELTTALPDGSALAFLTIVGDRWTLRVVTKTATGREFIELLRTRSILSQLVIDRGIKPWPAGMPLPLAVPDDWESE